MQAAAGATHAASRSLGQTAASSTVPSGLAPPPLADEGWPDHMAGSHHGWADGMRCIECGSEAVTERPERTAQARVCGQ